MLAVLLLGGAVMERIPDRMDGFTNDPDISEAKYLADTGSHPNYFQMHLAGPGLTAWDYSTGAGIDVAVFAGSYGRLCFHP